MVNYNMLIRVVATIMDKNQSRCQGFSLEEKSPGNEVGTKMLTHLSKTNAFYRRLSVTEKHIFLSIAKPRLSSFSMLKYAPWTLSRGYNIEKGRGGCNVKIRD